MIEHTWVIPTTEYETATGGITVAHWRVTAQDGDLTASAYGTAGFTPDATSPDFKPFDQLTETDVLGWVWASEEFDKDQMEANLAAQIEKQKNPPVVDGLPWG